MAILHRGIEKNEEGNTNTMIQIWPDDRKQDALVQRASGNCASWTQPESA